jgi:CheY-like chemotaxis protein
MSEKILIADDDPDVVEDLTILFEEEGFEIVTARDGAEALEKIRAFNPKVVILDLLMPRVDGFAVFNMLRDPGWAEWSRIPVIVLTSVREEISQRRYQLETGLRMDYAAYVEKPYDHEQLLQIVKSLIEGG